MKRTFVFSSNEGVKEAVINGLGITVISRLVVRKEIEAHELKAVLIKSKDKLSLSRRLCIIHRKEPTSSKAKEEFLNKLRTFKYI